MNAYIGIDIGKKGGIAYLCNGDFGVMKTPSLDNKIDHEEFTKMMLEITAKLAIENNSIYMAYEKTSSMPHEGVSSAFSFGIASGGVIYTAHALKHLIKDVKDVISIAPSKWKKHFNLIAPDCSKYEKKLLSVRYCNAELGTNFKNGEDGLADALLIAHYLKYIIETGEENE